MATQSVEFRAVTGQTITVKLFTAGSDTEVASVTATEATNRKGTYTAAFTDVAAGEYQLLAFNATPTPLASWWVTLTATTATLQVYDRVDKDGITRNNWAALTVDHTSTGSFGALLNTIGKVNLVIEGTVTNGVTPTTLTFSSNVDEFTDAFNNAILLFISGSLVGQSSPIVSYTNADGVFLLEKELTSAPVDGDKFIVIAGTHVHSVASIQNGLATLTSVTTLTGYVDTEVAAIKAVTDKMDGMLILDGSVYQFTTNAVENVAGTPVYVYPLAIGQEQRNTHQEITVYTSETGSQYFFAVDSDNTAIDLTGLSLEFRVGDNKTKAILYTASTADATLTVTLTNKVTFTKSTKFTRFANSDVSYSLRNMSAGGEVLLDGPIRLKWAP